MGKIINILKKIKFQSILWLFFYILLFALCFHNSSSYLDPDFGWHLKMGQEIINTKTVPHINTINYTLINTRWVDHEWLSEVFLYKANGLVGYQGLEIIFSLLTVLVFFIVNCLIAKDNKNNKYKAYVLMPLELLALFAILPSSGIRLQEIGLLFFLLLLLIINRYENTGNYKILWWLIPLLYLWSNLHGTFLIAFFICGLFAAVKIIELFLHHKWPNKFFSYDHLFSKKQIVIFIIFSFIAGLTTLLTPYGTELYSFLFTYSNTYYMSVIEEWWPQWFFPYSYAQILYISFVLSILFLDIYLSIKKSKKMSLFNSAMLIIFIAMALKSRRHTQLLAVVSIPLIFNFFKDFLDLNNLKTKSENSCLKKIASQSFIILILSLIIISKMASSNYVKNPFTDFCSSYPCAATNFLKQNPQYQNYNIYNDYAWGGFLIWTYPEKQLFIDGRMPQVSYEKYTILQEYKSFYDKDPNKISAKITKHHVGLFLLANSSDKIKLNWLEKYLFLIDENKVNEQKDELKDYLNNSTDWKIIYQDTVAIIYAKNNY